MGQCSSRSLHGVVAPAQYADLVESKTLIVPPYPMPAGYIVGGLAPAHPENEMERRAALAGYGIMGTDHEEGFDSLAQLASSICDTPVALISFIDGDRQWFKATCGPYPYKQANREISMCAHVVSGIVDGLFEVPDTRLDPRFADHPLVSAGPGMRFYAGAPIINDDGFVLGCICAADLKPRLLSESQRRALMTLAGQCMAQLELKKQIKQLTTTLSDLHDAKLELKVAKELAEANQALSERAKEQAEQAKIEAERCRVEAERANEHKTAFLANMSHEIRTPLNGILGTAWLLADTTLSHEQTDLLSTIQTSGDHLLTVLNDILDFSKQEAGKLELEMADVSPAIIIEQAIHLTYRPNDHAHLDVWYHVGADCPPLIRADCTRLRQIISNLISNALKFSSGVEHNATRPSLRSSIVSLPCSSCTVYRDSATSKLCKSPLPSKRGAVWIEVHASKELSADGSPCVQFGVHDTGIGISEQSMQLLFRSFTQVHGNPAYGGSGLGLSISRGIIHRMQGRVWAESKLGHGASFYFTIPSPAEYFQPGLRSLTVDDSSVSSPSLDLSSSAEFMDEPVVGKDAPRNKLIIVNNNDRQTDAWTSQLNRWGIDVISVNSEAAVVSLVRDADIASKVCAVLINHQPDWGIDLMEMGRALRHAEGHPKLAQHIYSCSLPGNTSEMSTSTSSKTLEERSPSKGSLITPISYADSRQSSDSVPPAGTLPPLSLLPLIGLLPSAFSSALEQAAIDSLYACMIRQPVFLTQLKRALIRIFNGAALESAALGLHYRESSSAQHTLTPSRTPSSNQHFDSPINRPLAASMPQALTSPTPRHRATKSMLPARKLVFANIATECPLKLLVVEDNPVNMKLLTHMLRNMGYEYTCAVDGREAYELMVEQGVNFDVVLMDLQMPRMSGLECTRRVLKHYEIERSDDCPPLFCALTASAMDRDRKECGDAGMTQFISKPINPVRLQVAIKEIYRACAEARNLRRRLIEAAFTDLQPFTPLIPVRAPDHSKKRQKSQNDSDDGRLKRVSLIEEAFIDVPRPAPILARAPTRANVLEDAFDDVARFRALTA